MSEISHQKCALYFYQTIDFVAHKVFTELTELDHALLSGMIKKCGVSRLFWIIPYEKQSTSQLGDELQRMKAENRKCELEVSHPNSWILGGTLEASSGVKLHFKDILVTAVVTDENTSRKLLHHWERFQYLILGKLNGEMRTIILLRTASLEEHQNMGTFKAAHHLHFLVRFL